MVVCAALILYEPQLQPQDQKYQLSCFYSDFIASRKGSEVPRETELEIINPNTILTQGQMLPNNTIITLLRSNK